MKTASRPIFIKNGPRPVVIAGPCMAESAELLEATVVPLTRLARELDFHLVFKSSFDKANRSSVKSPRGPGMKSGLERLAALREWLGVPVTTDIHDASQCDLVAKTVDMLQVPAFLCRQTDLLLAAADTGKERNAAGPKAKAGDIGNIAVKDQIENGHTQEAETDHRHAHDRTAAKGDAQSFM